MLSTMVDSASDTVEEGVCALKSVGDSVYRKKSRRVLLRRGAPSKSKSMTPSHAAESLSSRFKTCYRSTGIEYAWISAGIDLIEGRR